MIETSSRTDYIDTDHFYQTFIGSFSHEFLPMALKADTRLYRNMLIPACGYGLELIAARRYFGEQISLTGIDNDAQMVIENNGAELYHNFSVARAQFYIADMTDISGVLSILAQKPDIIAIRHPGKMRTSHNIDEVITRVLPWVHYAATSETTLLLSFFSFPWEHAGRDHIVDLIRSENPAVTLQSFDKLETGYRWFNAKQQLWYEPDYYGFRIN